MSPMQLKLLQEQAIKSLPALKRWPLELRNKALRLQNVEEMTRAIMDTTKNSAAAAEAARNAGVIARDGSKVVNQTIEGMNRVA
jgi:hypothetical protein